MEAMHNLLLKKTVLCLIVGIMSIQCFAQNRGRSLFSMLEVEAGVGAVMGNKLDFVSIDPGMQFYLETRLNIPDSAFDIGMQFSVGGFYRSDGTNNLMTKSYPSLLTFIDYSFLSGKRVQPFVGLGVGGCRGGYQYVDEEPLLFDHPIVSSQSEPLFVLCPRIGVEIMNHFRISIEYKNMMDRYFNHAAINLGFVFGRGGR